MSEPYEEPELGPEVKTIRVYSESGCYLYDIPRELWDDERPIRDAIRAYMNEGMNRLQAEFDAAFDRTVLGKKEGE